jgi:hypothetical protein
MRSISSLLFEFIDISLVVDILKPYSTNITRKRTIEWTKVSKPNFSIPTVLIKKGIVRNGNKTLSACSIKREKKLDIKTLISFPLKLFLSILNIIVF